MFSQAATAYWRPSKDPADRDPDPASLLYTVLPTLIQRRVPRIPSLRRTGSRYTKAATPAHHRDSSDASSEGSLTPPPSYRTSAQTPELDPEDTDIDPEEPFQSFPPSRPSTSGSSTPQHLNQSDSGVQWKYAKQGFSLLALAAQEESLLEQDPVFGRKLYLDSLGYLSRGLPADLSAAEVAGLRGALPDSLSGPMGGGEVVACSAEGQVERRREGREVSMLHEGVASITLQLFLVLSFVLPYVQLLLRQAYQYDRRYRVSDKFVAQSYQLVDHLGRHAMLLATHVGAMNDGQIGVVLPPIPPEMATRPAEAFVECDGINYFTLLEQPTNGAQHAPCILLIHALMSNLHMWDATATTLHATGYRTLRYDHIGHNRTPAPNDTKAHYHLDDLTRHAHQLVRSRLGHPHPHALIGCSIGGSMAFRYATLYPQDVGRIISVASPGLRSPDFAHELWTQRLAQFDQDLRTGDDTLCRETVARWVPGERAEDDGVREEALRHVRTCGIEGYRVLVEAIRGYDYEGLAGDIGRVRMLVVAGEEDQAGRRDVLESVAGRIEGAEFGGMEWTGHLPPMQKPGVFGGLMTRFLAEG
ncbi:hypothetical protein LTR91_016366 [Friedmanniomyces endolithicus]|uniref:AB hydrolase-1 domain-containing protein n=1 Tax=Friedmanniomyces endolithicus TaxID=329885 RepID=A0AAN6QKV6_9PEZI|nr:hypothetical protein LTR57_006375 [Friedmanniomyces endolithicus]KAK0969311.1 hypothetical protein LTR91_016366 [Friedmanniomyces endolithicus]KAK1047629.1 hypothetical protein LTS16_005089 [Friedmanniomyces endolithicus]